MKLILLVFAICVQISIAIDTKIELLQIVTRHGIRTPVNLYKTNPYNETFWNQYGGFGGLLTPAGINQHYNFGKHVRKHYADFLTQPFDSSRVFARATDYDRALMSAYAFLTGLFPPSQKQVWNSKFQHWYPIPVRANDKNIDPVLRGHGGSGCPRYSYLKSWAQTTPAYHRIQDDNKDFIKLMANYTGIADLDLYTMWKVADNYMVENALKLDVPAWVLEHKEKILALNNYNFLFDYYTVEMAKLISGSVLNDMKKNIDSKIKENSKRQLYLYSSHDTYIAALHKLLGLSNPIVQPNFASGLFFELRKAVSGNDYFIRVLYKNNVDHTPIKLKPLKIEGCEELCPLDFFYNKIATYLVTDFSEVCSNDAASANKVASGNPSGNVAITGKLDDGSYDVSLNLSGLIKLIKKN